MTEHVLGLEACGVEIIDRVGGKCAGLGSLTRAGFPVPPGFAITTSAWRSMLAHDDLAARIDEELGRVASSEDPLLPEVSRRVRLLIDEAPIEPAVEAAVRRALDELSERCGAEPAAAAVRSSATAEDLPSASFAGMHDTALWVQGADEVLRQVRRCWSSLYTARAIAYRLDNRFPHRNVLMAVAVQQMVDARTAGVAFTLNPTNGDRSKIAIDASWGLGEAVVSGEVTPDNFLVDKVILEIVRQVVSPKDIEHTIDRARSAVVRRDVEPERRTRASLSTDEILAVAGMAKRVEAHFGSPQDIEWAIDAGRPGAEPVVLLQSRPETVWSRKPRDPVTTGNSRGMAGLVHTLVRGVSVKTTK